MAATRRLSAILAADVAGYSRLMGVDEEGTLAALKSLRSEVADPKINDYHGRIVKTTGDGLLVEFASAVNAVNCAVDMQRKVAERNSYELCGVRMEFRIGINVGDIIVDDDNDIFGDGVNVAARLEALAEPGGICVSRVVRDQLRGKGDFRFEDHGTYRLKNITHPVHLYRIPPNVRAESSTTGMFGAKPASTLPLPSKTANYSGRSSPERRSVGDGSAARNRLKEFAVSKTLSSIVSKVSSISRRSILTAVVILIAGELAPMLPAKGHGLGHSLTMSTIGFRR